jgi:predicted MFS family arabinose efflux permease
MSALMERKTPLLLGIVLFDAVATGILMPLVYLYCASEQLRCSDAEFGLLGTLYGGAQLASSVLLVSLVSRFGVSVKFVYIISLLGTVVGYGLPLLEPSFRMLVCSRIVVGLTKQSSACARWLVTHQHGDDTSLYVLPLCGVFFFFFAIFFGGVGGGFY